MKTHAAHVKSAVAIVAQQHRQTIEFISRRAANLTSDVVARICVATFALALALALAGAGAGACARALALDPAPTAAPGLARVSVSVTTFALACAACALTLRALGSWSRGCWPIIL